MEASQSIDRGPRKHHRHLPSKSGGAAFKQAVAAAVPVWSSASIRALFDNRVGWTAIDNWFAGRRNPPQWALDCVAARGAAILDPLALVKPGPGYVAGKHNLPCFQKEKGAR